jgi:hypothetical protein
VKTEDKFVIVLAVFSVLLLVVGTLVARRLSGAPPRVIRILWPLSAALTFALYATLVFIARTNVKG